MFYNSTRLRFALQKFEDCWGFLIVFRVLLLGVFSFVQFVQEGPLILPLLSSLSFVTFLSPVSFLLLIYSSLFLIKKKKI